MSQSVMTNSLGEIALRGSIDIHAVDKAFVIIEWFPHPFRETPLRRMMAAGWSVLGYVEAVAMQPTHWGHVHVCLNDQPLAPEWWSRVRPKAGTHLSISIVPRGGLLRSVLLLGVALAALAASIAFPPLIGLLPGSIGFALAGAAAGLAVGVVGSILINALVPVRPPQLAAASAGNPAVSGGGRPEASPTFSLTAPRNDERPWGPIPVVLGRHRQTPPYATKPYSELLNNEQYIRALFVWGIGPLEITDIRVGDSPLSQFADVQIETFQGWPTDGAPTLVTNPVFEDGLSLQLLANTGFHTRTTAREVTSLSIDLVLPQGLAQLTRDGDLATCGLNLQADYRPLGGSSWTALITPGPEVQVPAATFDLPAAWEGAPGGSDPSSQGHQIWVNTQTGLIDFASGPPRAVGAEEFPAIPAHVRSIARVVVTGDTLNRIVDQPNGDLMGFRVTNPAARQLHVEQGTYFSGPPTFAAAQQTVIRRTFATGALTVGQYEVRVKRVTPDTTGIPSITNQIVWAVIRSQRAGPATRFQVPMAMTAIRIRASEQLSGALDTLNGICQSILPTWNSGTATWTAAATRNPAAAFRAVLQGPATHDPIPDSDLDLPSLQAWSEYCDSKGLTFDAIRDFRASNWEALLDVVSAGRGTVSLIEGKWSVAVDELLIGETPVQVFTPRNSWEFRAEKAYRTLPHAFRLRFLNEAKDWRQDETFAYQDGYSAANASIYEQLELPGQTNEASIVKQGRFHFGQLLLRPETYSFSTDFAYLRCHRMDRIRVAHDVPMWALASARVIAVFGLQITLDERVTMERGKQYAIRIYANDGSSTVRTVENVGRETDQLDLVGIGTVPDVGTLITFGESGQESINLIVLRVEPGTNLTARLYCVDESPGIHEADSGPITPWNPQMTVPVEFRLVENGGFDHDEVLLSGMTVSRGVWVFDDAANMSILVTDEARHGRSALRLLPGSSGDWARPNGNLPIGVAQGQHAYVEVWVKAVSPTGSPQAMLALGFFSEENYLFHAAMGEVVTIGTSYTRVRVDVLMPSAGFYVHPQLRITGLTGGTVYVDDVLGIPYTLQVVSTSTISEQNNYIRMQDQSGGIWHVSVLEGVVSLDDQLTIGEQANVGATWAWIERDSPDATIWYIYPDTDGTLKVSDVQPSVGAGSSSTIEWIDKRDFRRWDITAQNEGLYQLVEAA